MPGPGRVDAFAVILNEVAARALGQPGNAKQATAPVNYPQLWGAPFEEWIQYSGLSNNAFTRNVGEVLGVFGDVNLTQGHDYLATTARMDNLQKLEDHMRKLKSPKWEDVFGKFTPKQKEQAERGAKLYAKNCAKCHIPETTHKMGEFNKVSLVPAGEFNPDFSRNKVFAATDPLYFLNLKNNWLSANPGGYQDTSVIGTFLKYNPDVLTKLRFPGDTVVDGKVIARGYEGSKFINGLLNEKKFGPRANGISILAQTTLGIGLKYMADHGIEMNPKDPRYQYVTGGAVPAFNRSPECSRLARSTVSGRPPPTSTTGRPALWKTC